MAESKNRFEIERNQDDNLKAFCEPVRDSMDSILYDHNIDKSGAFGAAIYGNYCCLLMSNADSIFGEIMDFYCHLIQGYME